MLPDVVAALAGLRIRASTEAELQLAVGLALTAAGIPHEREVHLGPGDRLDFLVGDVAVELKMDGTRNALLRQVHRYAEHERVGSIVVVTTRSRHLDMPESLRGKPVRVVSLLDGAL